MSRARVVPNASKIRGKLVHIEPEPDGYGSNLEIMLDEARNVDDLPNFAESHIGERVSVYVHPGLKPDLNEGDRLEARIAYRGDERGGRFALVEDDLSKI